MQLPDSAAVADALLRVYARPELGVRQSSGIFQTIHDHWAAFRHWLGTLLWRALPDSVPSLIMFVILGVLVLVAGWAVFALVSTFGTAPRPGHGGRGAVVQLAAREDADWWEQEARTAAAAGRYRDAALALYLAAVLRLEARGVLRYESGKTPGDYRREARSAAVASDFDRFIRHLLPMAFGAATPDARSFDELRSSASALGVNA